jgi:hypothetical protein
MKTDKRIFLYLEGELTPEEKSSFEKELNSSPELQNKLKLYSNFISSVEETKKISSSSNYFDNIIPEFRKRLESNKQKKYYPKIAYAFPALVILFLVAFFLFNTQNKLTFLNEQNLTVNNVDDVGNYDLMNFSIDELIPSSLSTNDSVKYNTEFNKLIGNELNISSDSTKYLIADQILDYNGIIDNISEKDADVVYNYILNKKF